MQRTYSKTPSGLAPNTHALVLGRAACKGGRTRHDVSGARLQEGLVRQPPCSHALPWLVDHVLGHEGQAPRLAQAMHQARLELRGGHRARGQLPNT